MKKKSVKIQNALLIFALAGVLLSSSCTQNAKSPGSQPGAASTAAVAATLTTVTADDATTIIKGLPPQTQQAVAGSPEQIRTFLDNLKELLAVAAEARKNGVADDPDNKTQLDFIAANTIASGFDQQNRKPESPAFADVTPEQIESYYAQSGNEAKFNGFVNLIKKRTAEDGNNTEFTEQDMKNAREMWAKIAITEQKARAAGFDQKRETQLQMALQQAQFLAREYANQAVGRTPVTDAERAEYVRLHPELDTSKIKTKAEDVLRRAKAGEDFAKLAREFSEDPGSKDKGGLYENVPKGQMVPEFETAALALENGKIADNLVESKYGYHIIKLESKNGDKYNVRHILLMTSAPDPTNPYSQPSSMKDKVEQGILAERRDKWLKEVVARNQISLPRPEEIKVDIPPAPAAPSMPKADVSPSDKKSK